MGDWASSLSPWDWWRIFNSAGAFIAYLFALWWTWYRWDELKSYERVRWLSFALLLFSAFYGAFEVVFLPGLLFRIPILTVAIIWAQASMLMMPKNPKKEEPRGRQPRLPRP